MRLSALSLALFSLTVFSTQAADAETKNARKGDVASSYELDKKGNFFRIVDGNKCQITNNVVDFKISQHKKDVAVAYYVRMEKGEANLYGLLDADDAASGNCPKTVKEELLEDLAKKGKKYRYNVVPSTKAAVIAIALSNDGVIRTWGHTRAASDLPNMSDYRLNSQFGKKGSKIGRYFAYALSNSKRIVMLSGTKLNKAKASNKRYRFSSLDEFERRVKLD